MVDLFPTLAAWFGREARPLPWRVTPRDPWGTLVAEVMGQQTPMSRVVPVWEGWMKRWPGPADLAAANTADVLRAWDRLGYPRRALRLQKCAAIVAGEHVGLVPDSPEELRSLPGIGEYTASAVLSFAFRKRCAVLDTNTRRVIGRVTRGNALPQPSLNDDERAWALSLTPEDGEDAAVWNEALMELGALICVARSPRCEQCPLASRCDWLRAGKPADEHAARRKTQAWHGTDRQARGTVMGKLRENPEGITRADLDLIWNDATQLGRAIDGLIADGLAQESDGLLRLPVT